MLKIGFAMLAQLAACASVALAQDAPFCSIPGFIPLPSYDGSFLDRPFLTGDWGGTRSDLAYRGLQADLDWTQSLQKITGGGLARSTGYGSTLDYDMTVDLARMNLIPAYVRFRAESRFGDSVNGDSGSLLPTDTNALFPLTTGLDEDVAFTITTLSYTQFVSEHFAYTIGKFDTLDRDPNEFASGRGLTQFMGGNFIMDIGAAVRLPYSTLGGGVTWTPIPPGAGGGVAVSSMIMASRDSSERAGFDTFGDGLSWVTEADTQYRLGDLPGGQNLGFLYSFDQDFAHVRGKVLVPPDRAPVPPDERHSWAVYWSAWQYLFDLDPNARAIDLTNHIADHQGLGLFARAGIADRDTNPVYWSASGGIGGRGILGRSNDTYGFGYYYSNPRAPAFSGSPEIGDREQGVEAFYNLAVTPAAQLTFDIQSNESALPAADDALIVGGRLRLVF